MVLLNNPSRGRSCAAAPLAPLTVATSFVPHTSEEARGSTSACLGAPVTFEYTADPCRLAHQMSMYARLAVTTEQDPGEPEDWLVRGGIARPADLLDSAVQCNELHGYYAISVWGRPGDNISAAAGRLPAPYSKVRPVRRSTLSEAGYTLRPRQDGHTSIMLIEPTLERCKVLSELFDPPMPNPALRARDRPEGQSP